MTTFEGADISHYQNEQGPVHWKELKDGSPGNYFACKGTQRSSYLDPYCKSNRENSANVDFRYRLIYHWLSPISQASVKVQAEWYFSQIGTLDVGEGFMIDAEENGITVDSTREIRQRFEDHYQRPGVVYSGAFVAGLWKDETVFTPETGRHLAAYTSEEKALKLPGVKQYPWDFWQYSSNGPVPGITGRCDMNRIDKDSKLEAICGYTTTPVGEEVTIYVKNRDQLTGPQGQTIPANSVFIQDDATGKLRQIDPDEYTFRKINDSMIAATLSTDKMNFYGIYNPVGGVSCQFHPTSLSIPAVPGIATPV